MQLISSIINIFRKEVLWDFSMPIRKIFKNKYLKKYQKKIPLSIKNRSIPIYFGFIINVFYYCIIYSVIISYILYNIMIFANPNPDPEELLTNQGDIKVNGTYVINEVHLIYNQGDILNSYVGK